MSEPTVPDHNEWYDFPDIYWTHCGLVTNRALLTEVVIGSDNG